MQRHEAEGRPGPRNAAGPGPGRVRRDLRARAVLGRRLSPMPSRTLVESEQIRILDLVGVVTGLRTGGATAIEAGADLRPGAAGRRRGRGRRPAERGRRRARVQRARARQVGADRGRRGSVGPAAGGRGTAQRRAHRRRASGSRDTGSSSPDAPAPPRPEGEERTMRRVASSRRGHVDLLRRRPVLGPGPRSPPGTRRRTAGRPARALIRLVERGVLSAEELERHEERVFRRSPRT